MKETKDHATYQRAHDHRGYPGSIREACPNDVYRENRSNHEPPGPATQAQQNYHGYGDPARKRIETRLQKETWKKVTQNNRIKYSDHAHTGAEYYPFALWSFLLLSLRVSFFSQRLILMSHGSVRANGHYNGVRNHQSVAITAGTKSYRHRRCNSASE